MVLVIIVLVLIPLGPSAKGLSDKQASAHSGLTDGLSWLVMAGSAVNREHLIRRTLMRLADDVAANGRASGGCIEGVVHDQNVQCGVNSTCCSSRHS